jgi:phosphatidylinositol-3-phosphatase
MSAQSADYASASMQRRVGLMGFLRSSAPGFATPPVIRHLRQRGVPTLGIRLAGLLGVFLALGFVGVGGGRPVRAESSAGAFPTSAECGGLSGRPAFQTWHDVVVIAFENMNQAALVQSQSDPYLRHLISDCGEIAPTPGESSSTGYHAIQFPSLPNYLAATSGTIPAAAAGNGVKGKDCSPGLSNGCFDDQPSLFSQLGPGGWLDYTGGMYAPGDTVKPGPATTCELRNSSGLPLSNTLYTVRHNPAVYYTDQNVSGDPLKSGSGCSTTTPDDLALPAFPSTTPPPLHAFTWISPDICDDGHSATYSLNATSENIACPGGSNRIANIDAFLQQFLPPLLESPTYTQGDEAIVLWFDSPSGSNPINSTPIPLVVLSAYTLPGTVRDTGYYTHYDLLRTLQDMLEPAPTYLGQAATATDLRAAFNLCNTTPDTSGQC